MRNTDFFFHSNLPSLMNDVTGRLFRYLDSIGNYFSGDAFVMFYRNWQRPVCVTGAVTVQSAITYG